MAPISIRPGSRDDAIACTAVWQSTVDASLPPPTEAYSLYDHEIETGTFVVAERAGAVCGFGGSVVRGGRWFLADLFVQPSLHGTGVGRQILNTLIDMDEPGCDRATMASSDPRALTLYVQHGMTPRWPCFSVAAPASAVTTRPSSVEVELCEPATLLRVARDCSYPLHGEDLAYWLGEVPADCVQMLSAGTTVAGGVVRWGTPFALSDPTAISLGPVFGHGPGTFLDSVDALVHHVAERAGGRTLRCYVPGPSPTLRPLLDAGFRIEDTDLFCSSGADSMNPAIVLPSHDLL